METSKSPRTKKVTEDRKCEIRRDTGIANDNPQKIKKLLKNQANFDRKEH